MKDLNECTAEVFRRSEKRIEKRKRNRKRGLNLCVSLCFIFMVSYIIFLLTNDRIFSDEYTTGLGGLNGNRTDIVQVEIKNPGNADSSNKDANEAELIYHALQTAFTASGNDGQIVAGYVPGGNVDGNYSYDLDSSDIHIGGLSYGDATGDHIEDCISDYIDISGAGYTAVISDISSGYRIVFTTSGGSKIIFSLKGSVLTNESTGQTVILSKKQLSDILTALGLNETFEEESK